MWHVTRMTHHTSCVSLHAFPCTCMRQEEMEEVQQKLADAEQSQREQHSHVHAVLAGICSAVFLEACILTFIAGMPFPLPALPNVSVCMAMYRSAKTLHLVTLSALPPRKFCSGQFCHLVSLKNPKVSPVDNKMGTTVSHRDLMWPAAVLQFNTSCVVLLGVVQAAQVQQVTLEKRSICQRCIFYRGGDRIDQLQGMITRYGHRGKAGSQLDKHQLKRVICCMHEQLAHRPASCRVG